MSEAFYVPDGPGRFVATDLTIGPWDRTAQHAGPPAALLGRALEATSDRADMQVARVTFDILRPVPIAPLAVTAKVLRPGKRVELIEATMRSEDIELMRATAWRIRTMQLELDGPGGDSPTAGPEKGEPRQFFATGTEGGYVSAMEWRFVSGSFLEPGSAAAWMRMRYPLVPGEEPSPLVRVLAAADSASGISAALDYSRWLFVNPDLSVYLHRMPMGEWVQLAAVTTPQPHGVGVASSVISDRTGPIGHSLQTLYIAEREEPLS